MNKNYFSSLEKNLKWVRAIVQEEGSQLKERDVRRKTEDYAGLINHQLTEPIK